MSVKKTAPKSIQGHPTKTNRKADAGRGTPPTRSNPMPKKDNPKATTNTSAKVNKKGKKGCM